ncbi:MAG: hypothetical protein K9J06_11740 [Flavobacteriales bacterium]|nr:hypothetical protein [Flavobacteriales bacterium]
MGNRSWKLVGRQWWPVAILTVIFVGCKENPHLIDLTGSAVQVELKRLDEDCFNLKPNEMEDAIPRLEARYGDFFDDYTAGVLRIGQVNDPAFAHSLSQFITDASMRSLYDDSRKDYADVADLHGELNLAFSYFHHHFPDSTVPEVVLNISGLNYAIVATQTTLAIGVDMFLGADYPAYPMVGLPQHIFRNMKRDQLVPQAIKGWLQSMYEETAPQSTLLDHMILHGKILYALDALLPGIPDSAKIGYTVEEMKWCRESELAIWSHLVEQDMLYTTDRMLINKWVNQAPFIAGIPKQSPGRLGHWVGWAIVRRYMQENPDTPLQELMAMTDSQLLLSRSRYKPEK